jgi:predicted nucleic acid-binding protein
MKALVDTNVLLDTIFHREPFCAHSDLIFDLVEMEKIEGCISVQSLKDVFFFCNKAGSQGDPFKAVERLSFIFTVIDVTGEDSLSALMSDIEDYEDGLLVFSALRNDIRTIITRNKKDFFESHMIVIDPKEIDKFLIDDVEAGSVMIDNVYKTVLKDVHL